MFRSLAAALALLMVSALGAQAETLEKLQIRSGAAVHDFSVEVMNTDAERAKGLMFRRYLPADRGMLFDFKTVQPVGFWMQNTYIPLDMLFIRANGTIARIEAQAEPLSTRTIPSGEPVLGVLEINGGLSDKLGIKPGDVVVNRMFKSK